MSKVIYYLKEVFFWNNNLYQYLLAIILFIVFFIIFTVFHVFILEKLKQFAKKTKTKFDDIILSGISSIRKEFYIIIALYLALDTLYLHRYIDKTINIIIIFILVIQITLIAQGVLKFFIDQAIRKAHSGTENQQNAMSNTLFTLGKVILWITSFIFILSNLGINITSLIAGVGIGGIAIAFALQNILSDLFSSFAIYFDRPFEVGDFIVIGDKRGKVEYIGIKTTRLRAVDGEEVIIANRELTTAHIQNFKRMEKRRGTISIGVLYETPIVKLKKIPKIMEEIAVNMKNIEFNRASFVRFADSALIFEMIFFVKSSEYSEFAKKLEEINFKILEKLNEEKINMAYPTQTLYLKK